MKKTNLYLILRPKGWGGLAARLTATLPSLAWNERAVRLDVELPDSFFTTPLLRATVKLPENSGFAAPEIQASVLENVKEVLEQQTGAKIEICVVEPTREA